MQNACTVLCCLLWAVRFYSVLPHYLTVFCHIISQCFSTLSHNVLPHYLTVFCHIISEYFATLSHSVLPHYLTSRTIFGKKLLNVKRVLLLLLLLLLSLLLLFSTYALQPSRLIVRTGLDVSTFATRCLHACHYARAPSGGRWNCGREISGKFCLNVDIHVTFRDLFTCRKAMTWDRRLYFPSEERGAEDFSSP